MLEQASSLGSLTVSLVVLERRIGQTEGSGCLIVALSSARYRAGVLSYVKWLSAVLELCLNWEEVSEKGRENNKERTTESDILLAINFLQSTYWIVVIVILLWATE